MVNPKRTLTNYRDMKKKIRPITGWADVGSHGGIFVVTGWHCPDCTRRGRSKQQEGKLAIYETEQLAKRAGVSNPVKVKIINNNL